MVVARDSHFQPRVQAGSGILEGGYCLAKGSPGIGHIVRRYGRFFPAYDLGRRQSLLGARGLTEVFVVGIKNAAREFENAMKTANPFIPTVPLMTVQPRNRRSQVKVAVFSVLTAQVLIVMGLLIQGCKTNNTGLTAHETELQEPVQQESSMAAVQPEATVAQPTAVLASVPSQTGTAELQTVVTDNATPKAELLYTVRSGDTLSRIAKLHNTSVKALKSANSLDSERLSVGKKLKIPEAKA